MGPHGGEPPADVLPGALGQRLKQQPFHILPRPIGHIGGVCQSQCFLAPAQPAMKPLGNGVQPFHKSLPGLHDLRPQGAKLYVPDLQHLRLDRTRRPLQQGVALAQGAIILLQAVEIGRPALAQLHIHKPAPFHRPPFYQGQILWGEHHHVQYPHQLPQPAGRLPVDKQALALPGPELDPDLPGDPLVGSQIHPHVSPRLPCPDQFPIPAGSVGPAKSA